MRPGSAKNQTPRVLLDCTHTYTSGLNTGIQRVVRNLCKVAVKLGPEYKLDCQPVKRVGDRFFSVSFDEREKLTTRIARWVRKIYRGIMSVFCALVPIPVLRRWFLPETGHHGILKVPHLIARSLRYRAWPYVAHLFREDDGSVTSRPGDILMVLEPNTFKDAGWQTIDEATRRGLHVGAIIYDLIPLTHGAYVNSGHVVAFENWLNGMAQRADFFIAISDTVRQELQEHLARNCRERQRGDDQFDSFRLGCDLDLAGNCETVRSDLRQLFAKSDRSPIYLLVATIEPRKNHMFLLDAFDKAWQAGSPAKLCLVGRYGWLCDEIVARIEQHPELGKRLFWYRDLSDRELLHCYQHADGLTYPSIKEGFGLPLIEALSHKLLVLASDIPIHREVGQEFCAYFNLDDAQELADMILALDRDPHCIDVRDPSEYDIADWKQSCREFLTACQLQVERLGHAPAAGKAAAAARPSRSRRAA